MLSRIQFTLYIRITYNKKCFLIALVFQNTFFWVGISGSKTTKAGFYSQKFHDKLIDLATETKWILSRLSSKVSDWFVVYRCYVVILIPFYFHTF